MKEILSAGDLKNAFYIFPSISLVWDEEDTTLSICVFKWFLDIKLYNN